MTITLIDLSAINPEDWKDPTLKTSWETSTSQQNDSAFDQYYQADYFPTQELSKIPYNQWQQANYAPIQQLSGLPGDPDCELSELPYQQTNYASIQQPLSGLSDDQWPQMPAHPYNDHQELKEENESLSPTEDLNDLTAEDQTKFTSYQNALHFNTAKEKQSEIKNQHKLKMKTSLFQFQFKLQAPRKRQRTTPEQYDTLIAYFKKRQNPSKKRRAVLAEQTELSERQVEVWFQNRRANCRKAKIK
jgi:hypothetical protein